MMPKTQVLVLRNCLDLLASQAKRKKLASVLLLGHTAELAFHSQHIAPTRPGYC